MDRITFKPSLLIKLSGIAALLAIPLSGVIVYLLLDSDPLKMRAFNYYALWILAVILPLGNFYAYLKGNWEVTLEDKEIVLTNNLIVKTLKKSIPYEYIKSIKMSGMLSKSIVIDYSNSSFSISQASLHSSGNLPKLEFKDGVLHGPARDLIKLKYEIEKRARIQDDDPYLPYKVL